MTPCGRVKTRLYKKEGSVIRKILCAVFFFIIFSGATTPIKVVYFTTLEWPPYTGEELPEQGASVVVAKAAFAAMGYTLDVSFFPWQRAVYTARNDKKYSGYFPEYYATDITEEFIFSDPMGEGPLGFIEPIQKPVIWKHLSDLHGLRIGTVSGYVNTSEFDQKAGRDELWVEPVVDDITNIKKLLVKRIDIAVMDKYVFEYLVNTDRSVTQGKKELQFNKKILENKKLYMCFRKDDRGEELVKIFNEGLKKLNYRKIQNDYFDKSLK